MILVFMFRFQHQDDVQCMIHDAWDLLLLLSDQNTKNLAMMQSQKNKPVSSVVRSVCAWVTHMKGTSCLLFLILLSKGRMKALFTL